MTFQRSALGSRSWRVSSAAGGGAARAGAAAAVGLLAGAVLASRASARRCSSTASVCVQSSARCVVSALAQSGARREVCFPLCTLAVPSGWRVTAWARTSASALCKRSGRTSTGLRTQLLAHPGDGVLPVRLGRGAARWERRCGGGLVAEERGDEGGEWLAGSGSVWDSCHHHLSLCGGW